MKKKLLSKVIAACCEKYPEDECLGIVEAMNRTMAEIDLHYSQLLVDSQNQYLRELYKIPSVSNKTWTGLQLAYIGQQNRLQHFEYAAKLLKCNYAQKNVNEHATRPLPDKPLPDRLVPRREHSGFPEHLKAEY